MTAQPVDISMFSGEVHPYAAAFPMLPDADLDALAADIKTNGLLNPILLDQDGRLLDGRNRLEACDRVGVKPTFEVVETVEPVALIMSANMQRRDMSPTRKAYYAVEGERLEPKHPTVRALAAIVGVSPGLVSQVQTVAEHTPEAFQSALLGDITHDTAYKAARELKEAADTRAEHRARLEREWPEVLAKGLTLEEAWAAYLERTRKEREATEAREQNIRERNRRLTEAVFYLHLHGSNPDMATEWLATYDPAHAIHPSTVAELDAAINALGTIRKGLSR